jgi:hypothetical protein
MPSNTPDTPAQLPRNRFPPPPPSQAPQPAAHLVADHPLPLCLVLALQTLLLLPLLLATLSNPSARHRPSSGSFVHHKGASTFAQHPPLGLQIPPHDKRRHNPRLDQVSVPPPSPTSLPPLAVHDARGTKTWPQSHPTYGIAKRRPTQILKSQRPTKFTL